MKYIKGIESYHSNAPTAMTLGKFDGLHRGHQKLVDKVTTYANLHHIQSMVFAFDMAPLYEKLGRKQESIMTNEERRIHLNTHVDCLMECPFTETVSTMTAEDFIAEVLVKKFHVNYIAVGANFRFGHEKKGNYELLKKYADLYGYEVEMVEKEQYKGRTISSTYIKEELKNGRIDLVNTLLGYPYLIAGEVAHGRKLGRTIGFPTMNVLPEKVKLLPPKGVYINEILVDQRWYQGVCNIGVKPTVGEEARVNVESFLFHYNGDAYGKYIGIKLHQFVRTEQKFDSVEALQAQMRQDIQYAKAFFRRGRERGMQ